mmetsp:Transcript_15019/g.38177  ORF Transcript_15019/g.38177 Transcript_15019/m.38177 type:complete len:240 (+) Transcript_15019:290-1009(+)
MPGTHPRSHSVQLRHGVDESLAPLDKLLVRQGNLADEVRKEDDGHQVGQQGVGRGLCQSRNVAVHQRGHGSCLDGRRKHSSDLSLQAHNRRRRAEEIHRQVAEELVHHLEAVQRRLAHFLGLHEVGERHPRAEGAQEDADQVAQDGERDDRVAVGHPLVQRGEQNAPRDDGERQLRRKVVLQQARDAEVQFELLRLAQRAGDIAEELGGLVAGARAGAACRRADNQGWPATRGKLPLRD